MSFVQRLRMANMFPVRSGLGNARINVSGPDDMYEAIEAGKELALWNRDVLNRQPDGLRTVGDMGRESTLREPLRFGGVTEQSNPGADILARSRGGAENTYAKMNTPQETAGQVLSRSGIKPNVQFPDANEEMERDLNRRFRESQIKENESQAAIAKQNADAKGWKTVTVTDPKDPTKQINVRHNDITGEVQPIELPNKGLITRQTSGPEIQKKIDDDNLKAARRENIKNKTQSSLDLISELLDDKDELTPEAERAVGKSSVGNWIPTTLGYSGSSKINRLKNERILDIIAEMKSQSRTGATGFGQMNIKELGVLEKAASMLDTGLDSATFKAELKRIREIFNRVLMDGPDDSAEFTNENKSTETKSTAPPVPQGFDAEKYEAVRRPDNKGWTFIKKVGK